MAISIQVNEKRIKGRRSLMLYGHFIEHFHRQIYNGIYDPQNPLSDEDGLRSDILSAMRQIKVPVLRWPGGCFVSSYHWKDGVGKNRQPFFDKAWRVEDPNTFGTDEYIKMCRKIGCEPYICTNAGTGTAEEMSDWVEYCNLESEGKYAKWRIENGSPPALRGKILEYRERELRLLGNRRQVCRRMGKACKGIRQDDEACGSPGPNYPPQPSPIWTGI